VKAVTVGNRKVTSVDIYIYIYIYIYVNKNKEIPVQACYRPSGFQEVEAPRFHDIRHVNVVSLSALRNGHLYLPPKNIPGTHFC